MMKAVSRVSAQVRRTCHEMRDESRRTRALSAEFRHAYCIDRRFFFLSGQIVETPPTSSTSHSQAHRLFLIPLSVNLAILQAAVPTPASSKAASKAAPAAAAIPSAAAATPATRRSALASTLSLAVAVGAAAVLPAGPAAAKGTAVLLIETERACAGIEIRKRRGRSEEEE